MYYGKCFYTDYNYDRLLNKQGGLELLALTNKMRWHLP